MIKKNSFYSFLALTLALLALGSCKKSSDHSAEHSGSNDRAEVFIISPADGETVANPVNVKFGIKGMEVVAAGTDKPNSGHHHLLIDVEPFPDMHVAIPKDEKHIHFGKGQTETTLELAKGKHTLQLLLGDKDHIPHNPPLISKKITVTVQ